MQARRKRRNRTQWQHIIDQQHQSGEAARPWCAANDISYASFVRWRKLLSAPDSDTFDQTSTAPFIELTQAPLSAGVDASPGWLLELDLPAGVQLRIARTA